MINVFSNDSSLGAFVKYVLKLFKVLLTSEAKSMSHNSALVFTVCALQFVAVLSEDATTSSTAAATGPCKNELATEFCELIGKKFRILSLI